MNRSLLPASADPHLSEGIDSAFEHQSGAVGPMMIGLCTQVEHPTSDKLVQVMWTAVHPSATVCECHRWMPRLHHISVEEGDYVLFVKPTNAPEAIVIGVLDRPGRSCQGAIELGAGAVLLDGLPPTQSSVALTASPS